MHAYALVLDVVAVAGAHPELEDALVTVVVVPLDRAEARLEGVEETRLALCQRVLLCRGFD